DSCLISFSLSFSLSLSLLLSLSQTYIVWVLKYKYETAHMEILSLEFLNDGVSLTWMLALYLFMSSGEVWAGWLALELLCGIWAVKTSLCVCVSVCVCVR